MDAGVCRLATSQERNVGGSSGAARSGIVCPSVPPANYGSYWQGRMQLPGNRDATWYTYVQVDICAYARWEWKCTDEASGVNWNQRRDLRIVPNYRVPFRDSPVAWQLPTPITQPFLSHTHFFSLSAPLQVPESYLITFSQLNCRQKDSLWSVRLTTAPSRKTFSALHRSSKFFMNQTSL